MIMSGEEEHIGKLVLAAPGVSFGVLIVGYLIMPSLQQILGLIAIKSMPYVKVSYEIGAKMSRKISRLFKRMTEVPFPTDGSLYDLGLDDGMLYQTVDGYTFHSVGDVSLLRNGCTGGSGSGVCSTTLNVPTTM